MDLRKLIERNGPLWNREPLLQLGMMKSDKCLEWDLRRFRASTRNGGHREYA